jgi:hypothetical protein
MNLPDKLVRLFRTPRLTRSRIVFALVAAVAADALQLALGPIGWAFADQIIDVIAMVLTVGALGFHLLLLPTFIVEFIPVTDLLPTWTGCAVAVIALRKRAQHTAPQPPTPVISNGKPGNRKL